MTEGARPRPGVIYVLDDSDAVLEAVARSLADLGPVETSTLWSSLGAKLVRATREDLLVCDLHMAMMSGAELCRIVRRYNEKVQIVFFTSAPRDAPAGLADAIVDKAAGLAGLRRVVEGLLAGPTPARASSREYVPGRV